MLDMSIGQQFADDGLTDLVIAFLVEIDLIDSAAGGDDENF